MLSSDDKSLFQKGSFVEVSSDSDGFTGVWYVAKVLEPPSVHLTPTTPDKGTREERFFQIEYQSLLCDDGSEKPLTEYVESSFVRPLPPNDEHDLQVYDVVDAMYLDGWWIGVVVKVNHESNVYSVYFENPPDLLHLRRYELRAHWDWEGGKWVRPQKQVPKVGGLACRVLKVFKFFLFVLLGFMEAGCIKLLFLRVWLLTCLSSESKESSFSNLMRRMK